MPRRNDIKKIMLIGSGPIIIGQACEFDYSGTQACKALKEEGFKVVLVNSNPATIMTDPEFADATYIEPLTADFLEKIVERERPDALLPTLGGQTALNLAVELSEKGVLKKYGVKLIGADVNAIKKAEDRELFKKSMQKIGLEVPESATVNSREEALRVAEKIGFPLVLRPSFTLGGTGGSIAYNIDEFDEYVEWGLNTSPVHQILIEKSVEGWKEFELEVMRDKKDNVVIICSIENFDPMGIHTGDSITVAPAQTLTDKEYQIMRDAAIKIIREIGVETGGSNIQFAINPENGKIYVIEMNPRVSRSSALASKATGFPIAKIATKLAVGYTLDEIPNDITKYTPASFEPTLDYVVVKIPKFAFEKFRKADDTLTTQMKSVGEVMAIGRTFKEALHKAMRSLESGDDGFVRKVDILEQKGMSESAIVNTIMRKLSIPTPERLWYIAEAFRYKFTIDEIYEKTKIDRWFLFNIKQIVDLDEELKKATTLTSDLLRRAKEFGFSDRRIGELRKTSEIEIRNIRKSAGISPCFKVVDTCAAEFAAFTPYLYSTYDAEDEFPPTNRKKIIILGSGPNRIGQGIEFDYCCVHASYALREEGYETIMINCNPETVSTDYDTSDRLYFEPLTFEDVMNVIEKEKPEGVILQFGGQTPLKLAVSLGKAGVRILGTSYDAIDIAEDRGRFRVLLDKLSLEQAPSGITFSAEEAIKVADSLGYPVMVRPSYVLGGRGMEIVYDDKELKNYIETAVKVSEDHPVLIDKYIEDATEVDVDAVSDGRDVLIGGVLEHVEVAGVHSGDSAMTLPPCTLSPEVIKKIKEITVTLAKELNVIGLINIQFAVKDNRIIILEVNPRASRTVPFISKSIGVPLAKVASRIMIGRTLKELGLTEEVIPPYFTVKESVFPFIKFPGVDTILGPEMKSTGEVMGIDYNFKLAFLKAQIAAGNRPPEGGNIFISVRDKDKKLIAPIARKLRNLGFNIIATDGTKAALDSYGVQATRINKVKEGRPHIVDLIKNGEIRMVINTTFGRKAIEDSYEIRRSALLCNVPYFTTIEAARAVTDAMEEVRKNKVLQITSIQEYNKKITGRKQNTMGRQIMSHL
jgi:carbamoyl-phosphate synthase large subunit